MLSPTVSPKASPNFLNKAYNGPQDLPPGSIPSNLPQTSWSHTLAPQSSDTAVSATKPQVRQSTPRTQLRMSKPASYLGTASERVGDRLPTAVTRLQRTRQCSGGRASCAQSFQRRQEHHGGAGSAKPAIQCPPLVALRQTQASRVSNRRLRALARQAALVS